jgi:acyl carrier protein
MALLPGVMEYLIGNAKLQGLDQVGEDDNLFQLNVLDSFLLVDFMGILEQHYGIRIPDSDVNPMTFRSINATEKYLSKFAK